MILSIIIHHQNMNQYQMIYCQENIHRQKTVEVEEEEEEEEEVEEEREEVEIGDHLIH